MGFHYTVSLVVHFHDVLPCSIYWIPKHFHETVARENMGVREDWSRRGVRMAYRHGAPASDNGARIVPVGCSDEEPVRPGGDLHPFNVPVEDSVVF